MATEWRPSGFRVRKKETRKYSQVAYIQLFVGEGDSYVCSCTAILLVVQCSNNIKLATHFHWGRESRRKSRQEMSARRLNLRSNFIMHRSPLFSSRMCTGLVLRSSWRWARCLLSTFSEWWWRTWWWWWSMKQSALVGNSPSKLIISIWWTWIKLSTF